MTENRDALLKLLEPFPAEQVGKLPRVTCGDCSDRRKTCSEHRKARCDVCKAWVSTKHIHLDYVGHADVTRRLLDTDPAWQWEALATDENGLPLLDTDDKDSPVGMWIKLTVLGVTRLGYGSCPSGQNDAVKVLIGDALRNAAMRFGVALDLWAKGDRADPSTENAVAAGGQAARRRPQRQDNRQQAQPLGAPNETTQRFVDLAKVAADRPELVGVIRQARQAGADMAAVGNAVEQRQKVLDSGPPKNQDGSVSRSRMTDEERTAAGIPTKAETRADNKAARDLWATGDTGKKAERGPVPPGEDLWTAPIDGDEARQS